MSNHKLFLSKIFAKLIENYIIFANFAYIGAVNLGPIPNKEGNMIAKSMMEIIRFSLDQSYFISFSS